MPTEYPLHQIYKLDVGLILYKKHLFDGGTDSETPSPDPFLIGHWQSNIHINFPQRLISDAVVIK